MENEENPYRRQNRFLKAVKIVDRIEELGLRPFIIKDMNPKNKARLAAEAGFPAPSQETWESVIDLFAKRVVDPLARKAAPLSIGSACTPLRLY